MSLRQNLLNGIKSLGSSDAVPLRLVFWDGEIFDFAPDPTVALTIHSRSVLKSFLTGQIDRLGDAYVNGEITVDGDVHDILDVGIRLAEHFGRFSKFATLAKPLGALRFRHSKGNDATAIQHHYDVPKEFYRPWLDRTMTYSCGYFPTGTEDIHAAQQAKIDHICRKLRLSPDDRLIDIGCGWGGLITHAAKAYGVRGVGVTNSPAQQEHSRGLIEAAGLSDRIEIRLQDYRDIPESEQFDKVVSVGMYEHVGIENLPTYFATVARLLRPGGTLLNHGIITTDAEGRPQGPPGGEFINRHVFPGGELSNLSRTLQEVARSGLEAVDVEDLRPHYARTLLNWVRRFEGHREEVTAAGGIERYRVWRIYLAGMAHAFDQGWLSIAQVIAYKKRDGRPAERPWSRGYQYNPDSTVRLAGPLDWAKDASDAGTLPAEAGFKSY
ncbi:MAG TPA: cyclopropane-fatty-acyl-phospholipid synthase family protein [Pararhizobium sp.]|nr:cyclopropane-fatty-acyl-phospholipid synthase family protein [Pararhizobium sp.]